MSDRLIYGQILEMGLFIRNNDINLIDTLETAIGDRQETIYVRGQINSHHLSTFVGYQIKKPRILMGKTIMILAPDGGGNQ